METPDRIKVFCELNHVRENTPITGKACMSLIERFLMYDTQQVDNYNIRLKEWEYYYKKDNLSDFKEDDLVVDQYGEMCKVLIINDSEFAIRRLKDNSVDSVIRSNYTIMFRKK